MNWNQKVKDKVYYFVSDIHLGRKGNKSNEEKIFSFLEFARRNAAGIFLLGDLFDFWWEYKTCIPKENLRFFFWIESLIKEGVKVYCLPGNHDWTLGKFLSRLGAIVSPEMEILLEGKPVFLTHGDFLDDSFLTSLSRFAYRSSIVRFLFSLLHPNLGLPLAKDFISFPGGSAWQAHLERIFKEFAQRKIEEGFFLCCLGHIHSPSLEKMGNGYYLNTGDWLSNFTYGFLKGEEVGLARWE
uniref:UDP-2,3-diacylglucosamine diphosphatase n=1 Tax=candidate division WOR-3 bacterium TaxID=2052148 RepID=A0A7C3Z2C6_UNCW3